MYIFLQNIHILLKHWYLVGKTFLLAMFLVYRYAVEIK